MTRPGLRQRLRYRFDNYMARGVGAQILLLAAAVAVLIVITVVAVIAFGVTPTDDAGNRDSFGRLVWKSLMHALDAGAVGGDPLDSWAFLFIMLFVTIGGIFVLSALIGILNTGFGTMVESLRRGRSVVVERGHTVILGWSSKVETLLSELAVANENQRRACVVILAERDKVEMDQDVAQVLGRRRLRVVTRSGQPTSLDDLALVSLPTSKAVIVIAPERHADGAPMAPHESDTVVLKSLLAVTKVAGTKLHMVAELSDARSEEVARMVAGSEAALVVAPPLISRLMVQTGRQSGLSMVYSELLDFAGVEMYVTRAPSLAGKPFRDAVLAYNDSALLGVLTKEHELLLPPPLDRAIDKGDQLIVISEDDDTAIVNGKNPKFDASAIVAAAKASQRQRERTLVLGASERLALVLTELDAYVAPGSETLVVGDRMVLAGMEAEGLTKNTVVKTRAGDPTDRRLLDTLDVASYDAILVLSETNGRTQEMADARTMITLLHLRDMAAKSGKHVPITSEILDIVNRDLASVSEADDFIVSNTLVSLLLAQVAENRHLARVFEDLFTPGGHEIYLKPAKDYVALHTKLPYHAVVEAALRRGEVALGLRRASAARDPDAAFGVVVNPPKDRSVTLGDGDRVIVLADD